MEPHEREQVRAGLILHVRDHVVRGRVADDAAPGAHRLHEIGRARRVLDLHGKPAAGKDAVLHGRVHRQIVGGAKLDEPDGGQGSHDRNRNVNHARSVQGKGAPQSQAK